MIKQSWDHPHQRRILMALHWKDYCEIADALNEAYPDQALKDMEDGELIRLVRTLPDFDDAAEPDEKVLSAIWNRWVFVAYPEG